MQPSRGHGRTRFKPGRNFTLEYIQAPSIEGYELTYRELAGRKVDILLATGNEPALRAARSAAGATPTVFIALDFEETMPWIDAAF
jgi:putative tryptophan/tyrosine transport system substrate-binding protein